jgi:ComF family protein
VVYGLLEKFFVESCPACGTASGRGFCAVCAAEFARVVNPCGRCGLTQPVAHCPRTQMIWDVDAVVAPFSYGPPLDHYLHALKYRGARSLGRAFALALEPALQRARGLAFDCLVAVPLHRARRIERGYNQAQEIARTLARALRVPALERGITRRAAAAAQTRLSARERRAGVDHVFRVERDLAGRRIAIVDDVVTTGATANALAAELKAAGAAGCVVLAVARTPEPAQARNV